MSEKSGIRRAYDAPRAVLVGGFGVAGLSGSGLFTGGSSVIQEGTDWSQSEDDTRARCVPGTGASTGCSPGNGVTGISI